MPNMTLRAPVIAHTSVNSTHQRPIPWLIKINGFIYQMVTMLLKCKWLVSVNCLISDAINQDGFAVSNHLGEVDFKRLEQKEIKERKRNPP